MRGMLAILLTAAVAGCLSEPAPALRPDPWSNPFLRPGATVRVQVDYVDGRMPSEFATDGLLQVMAEVGTQGSVELRGTLPPRNGPYTSADILGIHLDTYVGALDTWRDAEGTPVLHVLFLDANHTSPEVRGIRIRGYPLIAIFPDELPNLGLFKASARVPAGLPEGFERSVLVHEYGHVLGLVGCGLPQLEPRQNVTDPCHSTQDSSVMLPYLHQSSDLRRWALDDEGQPVWRFDADDWADIRAGQAQLPARPARAGSILSPTH